MPVIPSPPLAPTRWGPAKRLLDAEPSLEAGNPRGANSLEIRGASLEVSSCTFRSGELEASSLFGGSLGGVDGRCDCRSSGGNAHPGEECVRLRPENGSPARQLIDLTLSRRSPLLHRPDRLTDRVIDVSVGGCTDRLSVGFRLGPVSGSPIIRRHGRIHGGSGRIGVSHLRCRHGDLQTIRRYGEPR